MAGVGCDAAFVTVLMASLVGLVVSIAIEAMMSPRPSLVRPEAAWALHCGLWWVAHAAATLVLGRPWFGAGVVLAFLLMVVLVSNAKYRAMREPFVFQDYEYFVDTIRHPRLYIPFLGWKKFLGALTGFVLAFALGLWGEEVPEKRLAWCSQLGGIVITGGLGLILIFVAKHCQLRVAYDPEKDTRVLGFLASMWRYAEEEKKPPTGISQFHRVAVKHDRMELPHLVAVQSESFFDPRPLFAGIRHDVLSEWDDLKGDALAYGKLRVPAWGANTVRTEFAFLTGLGEDRLGVHRFNPYRAIASGWRVSSIATFLRGLGYRTLCVHPYPGGFYRRDRVYPQLGFEVFYDIKAFDGARRAGPYISDAAVADFVAAIVQEAQGPVFVFVITMENHGPLHMERVAPGDVEALYNLAPPPECDELTIYLRHLRNASRMIASLRQSLDRCDRSASLCWYGDHVPIMPKVYEVFGVPGFDVEYVIWNNLKTNRHEPREVAMSANELAISWLLSCDVFDYDRNRD